MALSLTERGAGLRTGIKQRVNSFLHGSSEPNRIFSGSISDEMANELLFRTPTVGLAMEHLANSEVHPTTKRELVHRLTKAVVTEAATNGIHESTLQGVSKAAGEFYGSIYWGGRPHSVVEYSPNVADRIRDLPIIIENRNFGSPYWEGIIRTRCLEEAESLKEETDIRNVVIVPVASGGLEPGIAFRELLGVPDFWVKPNKDEKTTTPLGDPHMLEGKDLVLIEDRIRTGASLGLVERFVKGFNPHSVTSIVMYKEPSHAA